MKCPYCAEANSMVIDSRLSRGGNVVRRRRKCNKCEGRFTTYERLENLPVMIVKKDNRREAFNREKLRTGIIKACEKRQIGMEAIEQFLDDLERELRESGKKEIPSRILGEQVMTKLHEWDDIAYVRFASVYREFKDVNDLMTELKHMLSQK